MPSRLEPDWLDSLVDAELERHDPGAALSRLPGDVRAAGSSSTDLAPASRLLVARSLRRRRADAERAHPTAAFTEDVRAHVALLLDLAVLRGAEPDPGRRRAEIAAFFAAALGEPDAAIAVRPEAPHPSSRRVVRALRLASEALATRFLPHGDPVLGLPLHPGYVALLRRRLARTAAGFHRDGRLAREALGRHAAYAERESVLLAEALAGLLLAAAPADDRVTALRRRQLARLGLGRRGLREARAAVTAPRAAAEIALAAPERMRPFLAEQLFVALLRANLSGDGPDRFVEAFVGAARLDAATLTAAQVEAAAQHGGEQAWFELPESALARNGLVAGDWNDTTDLLVERVSTTVTENLESLVTEIRETGELGQLLARAAAGGTLTAEEKHKVRAQLIDLAKVVPALAIFAAPGGMLLLPLLAKLLPFNVLPSAWARRGGKAGADTVREDASPAKTDRTG